MRYGQYVEGSYAENGGVSQDIYGHLAQQQHAYEQLLNGKRFLEGFHVLPNTVLCTNGTASDVTVPCATVFDTDYAVLALEQLQGAYVVSFQLIAWKVFRYPLGPIFGTLLIKSLFQIIHPMARYRGKFIGTSRFKAVTEQAKVENFLRHASCFPILLSLMGIGFSIYLIA